MKFISLLLAFSVALTGCSMFTKNGRQQRAYEKYVRKSSVARVKQQVRFRTGKPKMTTTPALGEPTEAPTEATATETNSGPQSVTEAPPNPH